ncbi:NAD-dependent epimerase/dehydratase family protein [Vibrio splendidus]
MNTLLTGATGFVGKEVIKTGLNPRVVIRNNEDLDCKYSFVINELSKDTSWDGAFDDIVSVIHLAGLAHSSNFIQSEFNQVNVDGTLHLAREAAKAGVKRFVFVSSIGVNGTNTNGVPFSENQSVNPHNMYAKSKYEAEVGLKKISSDTGLEVVIVRPTLVYGPSAPGNFGSLTKLVRKSPILPFSLVNNQRDFIAVQNLADLLVTCTTHPNAAGHTFLASDSETVSIKEFSNMIAEGLGKKLFQFPFPIIVLRLIGETIGKSVMMDQLLGDLQVDSSNLKEVLDWTPPFTMKQAMILLRNPSK